MSEEIFRKKSLDKVKSPENLDQYIQVANPGIWLLLISVIVLLAGACVWGAFGRVESVVETSVYSENGAVVCYVETEDAASLQKGMTVRFAGFEAVITEIARESALGYICTLQADRSVPDGLYEGKIVIQSTKPLAFVLN